MIWFGIAFVVAVVLAVRQFRNSYDPYFEAFAAFILTSLLGGLAAFLLSLGVGLNLYEKDENTYAFDVVAAKDGSSIEGGWSIFGGFVDDESYYFYYRQDADGGITQGKIRAANARIYEDQETRNYIEVTECDSHLWFWGLIDGCEPTYEIHVTEGSVKQDVEFDLE